MARISCIMTAYNARTTIDEAIGSIVGQSFDDWECIIVDDGSTDGTADHISRWAMDDARIKRVTCANQGQTRALNLALDQARGNYVARMDADDISEPERFAKQVEWLTCRPDCVALGTLRTVIDDAGVVLKVQKPKPPVRHDLEHVPPRYVSLVHPSAMIRRDALEQVGGYRPFFRYAQDVDLWLRLAEKGRLDILPEPLLRYRSSVTAISSARLLEQQLYALIAVLAAVARARGRPDPITEDAPLRLKPYLDGLDQSVRAKLESWAYGRLVSRAGNVEWPAWLVDDAREAVKYGLNDALAPGRALHKAYVRRKLETVASRKVHDRGEPHV